MTALSTAIALAIQPAGSAPSPISTKELPALARRPYCSMALLATSSCTAWSPPTWVICVRTSSIAFAWLGAQDRRLFLAFGAVDLGLFDAFRFEHRRPLVALGLHLPLHRLAQRFGHGDVLDLIARDMRAPELGGVGDGAHHPLIDLASVFEGLVELHRADGRAHRGLRQIDDGAADVLRAIGGVLGVDDLIIENAVDGDGGVVLGDRVLLRHVDHLFAQIEGVGHPLDDRPDEIDARGQRSVVAAQPLDDEHGLLAHEAHHRRQRQQRDIGEPEQRILEEADRQAEVEGAVDD